MCNDNLVAQVGVPVPPSAILELARSIYYLCACIEHVEINKFKRCYVYIILCNIMQYLAIFREILHNIAQYSAILRNIGQYCAIHNIVHNIMQYCAIFGNIA